MTLKKKKKHELDYLAVYRPTPFIQIMAFCIILFMLITCVFSDGGISNWMNKFEGGIFPILWAIALLVALWLLFMMIARDKLMITEDGVIWWYIGFRKEAAWSELSHFTWRRWGNSRRWGIALTDGKFMHLEMYTIVSTRSFFHRQKDLAAFQQSDIGQYFYQYAPHLFDNEQNKKKKK